MRPWWPLSTAAIGREMNTPAGRQNVHNSLKDRPVFLSPFGKFWRFVRPNSRFSSFCTACFGTRSSPDSPSTSICAPTRPSPRHSSICSNEPLTMQFSASIESQPLAAKNALQMSQLCLSKGGSGSPRLLSGNSWRRNQVRLIDGTDAISPWETISEEDSILWTRLEATEI